MRKYPANHVADYIMEYTDYIFTYSKYVFVKL